MNKSSLFAAMVVFAISGNLIADEPKTETVKKEPFSVYTKVQGVVESKSMKPIKADMKSWKTLEIESVVPEGTKVKKGDMVIRFKSDDYNKALKDAMLSMQTSDLDLKNAELEFEEIKKTYNMDRELAKREFEESQQDYQHYKKVEIPQRAKSAEYNLKSSEWSLENALEELNQLKQMYQEDELTEESEKIVLKRAERQVEMSKHYLDVARNRFARSKNVLFPRLDKKESDKQIRGQLAYDKSKITLPMKLAKAKIAFEKAQFAVDKSTRSYSELKNDGKKLVQNAPVAGVVIYGRCNRGKWIGASGTPNRDMEVGKVVPAGKVFMTIVDPQQLQLRIALDEKSLGQLAVNAPGFAIPAIMPAEKLPLRIETISRIAFADGKFDCTATLEFDNQKMILTPGMTCEIIVPSYVKTNAITVAKSSVFSDDEGLTHYVYKVTGDNKPDKATVKVGMTSGERTEIKQGLAAGDKILLKKPEPEKPESKTPAAKESEKKESK